MTPANVPKLPAKASSIHGLSNLMVGMNWFERKLPASLKRLAFRVHPLLPKHMRTIMAVEGYLAREEAQLLFELGSRVTDGCILEVGSYRGKSTIALALGSQVGKNMPVYAIEPHESYVGISGKRFGQADRVAFLENLLRTSCAEVVRLVNLRSEMISRNWAEPIGLLWIDGDHRHTGVKRDFECWAPSVTKRVSAPSGQSTQRCCSSA